MKALVIGGTGPSGPFIVEGLLKRGYEVTILHRGTHEVDFSSPVEHLHGDPHFVETLEETMGSRTFDLVIWHLWAVKTGCPSNEGTDTTFYRYWWWGLPGLGAPITGASGNSHTDTGRRPPQS